MAAITQTKVQDKPFLDTSKRSDTMNRKINKMTKGELFEEEKKIFDKISNAEDLLRETKFNIEYIRKMYEKEIDYDAKGVEEAYSKYSERKINEFNKISDKIFAIANRSLENEIKLLKKTSLDIRHTLYECSLCDDAEVEVIVNKKSGDEVVKLRKDCGREVCPYRDEFIKIANGQEIDIEKILRKASLNK